MRRRVRALLIAAGSAVLVPPSRAEDPPPAPKAAPLPRNDAAFRQRVNRAIDRGVEWLFGAQKEDGSFGEWITHGRLRPDDIWLGSGLGLSALALYALRACGAKDDDPRIVRGFACLRRQYLDCKRGKTLQNYGVSLTLLALEAHRNVGPAPGPDADRYGRTAAARVPIHPEDLEWMRELTAWLVAAQNSDGAFGYHSPPLSRSDRSNTQYSLLALKAARRCGIEVPARVWERALRYYLRAQERDGPEAPRWEQVPGDSGSAGGDRYGSGVRTVARARDRARGWNYVDGDRNPTTGSMTTGGVSSIVLCRSELLPTGMTPALDAQSRQAVWDGLAWLGFHFSVRENPGELGFHHYYLYGLERAGVLAGVTLMGQHDWYLEGAAYLVDAQHLDGGWSRVRETARISREAAVQARSDLQETCWALLFLKRATARVSRGAVATAAGDEELDFTGAASLDDRSFRDLFDAVFGKYVSSDPAGRSARTADLLRMGKRTLPLLILKLEDEDDGTRAAAIEVLRRTTGVSQGFDPASPEAARSAAVRAWEDWWLSKGGNLVADADAGKFREE